MKYLKLFESFEDIDSVCKKYGITNYTINGDGSIDVDGDVYLANRNLDKLPLKFRNVSDNFNCVNNFLTSLEGCPKSVGGNFKCSRNFLTSLEGCPKSIGGDFDSENNKVRTLEGFPLSLGGEFYCAGSSPVFELWVLFEDKDKVELFNDFGITDGEVVILDRLNGFLDMIGEPMVDQYHIDYIKKRGYKII